MLRCQRIIDHVVRLIGTSQPLDEKSPALASPCLEKSPALASQLKCRPPPRLASPRLACPTLPYPVMPCPTLPCPAVLPCHPGSKSLVALFVSNGLLSLKKAYIYASSCSFNLLNCLTLTMHMLVDRTIKLGESQDSLRMVLQPALRRCLDRPVSQQSATASRIKRVEAPRARRWAGATLEGAPITCAARPRLGAMAGW